MINPYESPPELRRGPLRKRLRRAMSLAVSEFQRGLERDSMASWDVVRTCVCAFAAFVILSMLALYIGGLILSHFGWL
ncbi:MAG: hypothetical protein AAGG48_13540 [Planctomycetota bacterium]